MNQRGNGNQDSLLSRDEQKEAGNLTEVSFCERYFETTKDYDKRCDGFCTGQIFSCLEDNFRYLFNCKKKVVSTDLISSGYNDIQADSCGQKVTKCLAGTAMLPFFIVGTTLTLFTDVVRSMGRACLRKNKKDEQPDISSSSENSNYNI